MAVSKDIRLKVLAETKQFQAEMAKIPGTTEKQAAAAARNFARNMIRAEREAAAAAQRTVARASASIDSLGRQMGRHGTDADRILSRLAPMLATIDPQLAMIASTAGDAADGIGRLAKKGKIGMMSLGVLLPVVVALGAAFYVLKTREEEATAKMEAASDAATKAQGVFGALSDSTRDLADRVRLATGQIDDLGLSLEKQQDKVNAQFNKAISLTETELKRLRERKKELLANANTSSEYKAQLELVNDNISRKLGLLETLKSKQQTQLDTLELLADAEGDLADAQGDAADGAEDSADSDDAAAEAARKRAEAARRLAASMAHIADVQAKAEFNMLSPLEQRLHLYDQEIAALDAIDQHYQGTSDTSAARAALEVELQRDIHAVREELINQLQRRQDEAHRRKMAQVRAERDAVISAATATGQIFGNLSGIAMQAAQDQAEAGEAGAARSLEAAKKLAAAEVAAATAVGLINAVARNAGRPIATAAAILAVLTTSAASAQQIAGLSLHTGGLIDSSGLPAPRRNIPAGVGPGEQIYRNRVVLEEERVLSPEATRNLGEEGARRLERGGQLVQPVYVEKYKHFDRFMQDELRRDGALSRAIGRNRTTGQRGVY